MGIPMGEPMDTFMGIPHGAITLKLIGWQTYSADGANTLQLFLRVALPLSWPVILTAGLIISLAVWNEFLFALTFISEEGFKPMATILFAFQWRFENNYALQSASAIMMVAPVAVLFILFQRRFISGLTSGGLKE